MVGSDGECVLVRIGPVAGCPACDRGQGCGAGVFGRLLQRRAIVLPLENVVCAGYGDVVSVGIPERVYVRLVSRLYLVPLLAALAGAFIGHHVGMVTLASDRLVDLATLAGATIAILLALPGSRSGTEQIAGAAVRLVNASPDPDGCGSANDPAPAAEDE